MNHFDGVYRMPCTVVPGCPLITDITVISSDGKSFHTHSKNLGEFTSGFPVGITPVTGEEVHIPELDAEALNLFLWYVHPNHRQPCLDDVEFGTLMKLAEAVEKYEVFQAIEVCKWRISQFVNEDLCVKIFKYAVKHDHRKLMDDTASIAVQNKHLRREMEACDFHEDIQSAFDRYTESWLGLLENCYNPPSPVLHKGGSQECKKWKKFRHAVVSKSKQDADVLSSFGSIVDDERHYLEGCKHCEIRADNWISKADRNISVLETFSSHLPKLGSK